MPKKVTGLSISDSLLGFRARIRHYERALMFDKHDLGREEALTITIDHARQCIAILERLEASGETYYDPEALPPRP